MADPASGYPTTQDAFATLDGTNDVLSDYFNERANAEEAIQGFLGVSGAAQSHNATFMSFLRDNYVGGRCYKKGTDEIYVGAFAGIITNAGDTVRKLRVVTSVTTLSASDLDTGSMAANTPYYIYATADAASTEPVFVFSANATTPSGYTYYKRIGWFYNETINVLDVTKGQVSSFTGGGNKNSIFYQTGAVAALSTVTPFDDSIPQITEGTEVMNAIFIPTNAISRIKIKSSAYYTFDGSTASTASLVLHQDAIANALICTMDYNLGSANPTHSNLVHEMVSGTTSAITYRIRLGENAGTSLTFNGGGGTSRKYGGVLASHISVEEEL